MDQYNLKEMRQLLTFNVKEDIKEFGKPALIYNYHYALKSLNAIDKEEMWQEEQNNLVKAGMKKLSVKIEVNIDGDKWECILWIYQYDEYNSNRTILDPLAMAVDQLVQGVCYLQFVKKKDN